MILAASHSVLNLTDFLQLTINGAVAGTAYGLLGVAFGLILGVTGRFHFAFSFTYTVSAYIAAQVGESFGLPFWLALVLGCLAGGVFGILMEALVYRRLAARAGAYALLIIFVASLGLSIAGQNLIALIWLSKATMEIHGVSIHGINVGSETFTNLQWQMVLVSWVLIAALGLVLARTGLGRMIRAVRANPEMSLAIGVNPAVIYLVVFAIGSVLGGVSAVFTAAQTSATPDMGFSPLFYAFVVAFLAGAARPPVVVGLVGLGVGLVQSWSGLFLSSQWSSLVVFGILFVYVAARPIELRVLVRRLSPAAA